MWTLNKLDWSGYHWITLALTMWVCTWINGWDASERVESTRERSNSVDKIMKHTHTLRKVHGTRKICELGGEWECHQYINRSICSFESIVCAHCSTCWLTLISISFGHLSSSAGAHIFSCLVSLSFSLKLRVFTAATDRIGWCYPSHTDAGASWAKPTNQPTSHQPNSVEWKRKKKKKKKAIASAFISNNILFYTFALYPPKMIVVRCAKEQ